MAKKSTNSVAGEAAPKEVIHIERGPWDIDTATVIDVQELSPTEVMVVTSGNGSYRVNARRSCAVSIKVSTKR